jgi:hypothetical protein
MQPKKEYTYEKCESNIEFSLPYLATRNGATFAFGNFVILAMAPLEPVRCIYMNQQCC